MKNYGFIPLQPIKNRNFRRQARILTLGPEMTHLRKTESLHEVHIEISDRNGMSLWPDCWDGGSTGTTEQDRQTINTKQQPEELFQEFGFSKLQGIQQGQEQLWWQERMRK